MKELKEQILGLVFRATQDETGDFCATDCTKAIMALVEAYVESERLGNYRSSVIDNERIG